MKKRRYRAQPIDPLTGRRVSLSASSRDDLNRAIANVHRVRQELRLGADPATLRARIARPVLVGAAWARWRLTVTPRSAPTVDGQRRHVECLFALDCRDLTAARLGAWWADLRTRVADATAAGVWQHLAQAVRLAVRVGELVAVPWGEWRPPRPSRAARQHPKRAACTSPEDLRRLVAAASRQSPEQGRAVLFLALTGLRQGEACGLAWSAVDLDAGTLLVSRQATRGWAKDRARPDAPPKGGAQRAQRMHGAVVDVLRAQRAALERVGRYHPDGPVWPARGGGWRRACRLVQPGAMSRWAREAGLPQGLPWVAHSMRHTCATLELLATGGDLRATAARTGHRDLEVLAGYLHAARPAESAIALGWELDERTLADRMTRAHSEPLPPAPVDAGRRDRETDRDAERRAYDRARKRALRAGATPEEAKKAGARARRGVRGSLARTRRRVM